VTDSDLLSQAVAELYAADLDSFTQRRGELAAAARAAGDRVAAKEISGLRRPTRSAWVINRLVRDDPTVPSRLAELGDELRASEASQDGARIRELSQARRHLLEELVRDAMAATGQDSLAVREEVSATLAAALADQDFAAKMAGGALLRAEQAPGFGPADMTAWTVPAPQSPRPTAGGGRGTSQAAKERAKAGEAKGAKAGEAKGADAAAAKVAAAAAAEAERERRRQEAIANAERAVAEASQAAEAAAERERADQAAVRQIEQQLTEAMQRLGEARRLASRANGALRSARQALSRLR
jgi:hypothetical protein